MVMGVKIRALRLTARKRDLADPLRGFRGRFLPMDPNLIYLTGHSVGRPTAATREALNSVVDVWAARGAFGWHEHWIDLPWQAGDAIAAGVVSAEPGEVIVSDSTSVNIYKLAAAVLRRSTDDNLSDWSTSDEILETRSAETASSLPRSQEGRWPSPERQRARRPGRRRVIVADAIEFPTDAYILRGLAKEYDAELRLIDTDEDAGPTVDQVREACAGDADLVVLSHVSYRSGAVADMAGITDVAHRAGALIMWDVSHSAGVVPVPLRETGADLAVGCTYKYLNAGPGSPGFLFVRRDLQDQLQQPIQGWFGHRNKFAMHPEFQPARDIARYVVGSPHVLGCRAVAEGARLVGEAGVERIHAKAQTLTSYAIELADTWLARYGIQVASPRDPKRRGAHVAFRHPAAAHLCQALAEAGVMCDFRQPDRLRFGLSPLYTSYSDVYEAMYRLRQIMAGLQGQISSAT